MLVGPPNESSRSNREVLSLNLVWCGSVADIKTTSEFYSFSFHVTSYNIITIRKDNSNSLILIVSKREQACM
jgi:hypothetical protein